METVQMINAVLNALNTIEVKGASNLNALLGCMQTLEQIRNELAKGEENGCLTDIRTATDNSPQ